MTRPTKNQPAASTAQTPRPTHDTSAPLNRVEKGTVEKGTAEKTQPHGDTEALVGEHTAQGQPVEVGGFDGPEPTRYGDWEHGGRCTDF